MSLSLMGHKTVTPSCLRTVLQDKSDNEPVPRKPGNWGRIAPNLPAVGYPDGLKLVTFRLQLLSFLEIRTIGSFALQDRYVIAYFMARLLSRRMTSEEALQLFQETGALLKGHFLLRSGLHSREFFQCAQALQEMPIVERFGKAIAEKVASLGATTVVAPAMGGLVIGQEIARQLGLRYIFVEKEEGSLVLRRGFTLSSDEKVLITEDVVTKGGRVQETIDIIEATEASIVGITVLVDRSGGSLKFNYPLNSLIQMNVETFEPDQLPPDLQSIPAVKPGS